MNVVVEKKISLIKSRRHANYTNVYRSYINMITTKHITTDTS